MSFCMLDCNRVEHYPLPAGHIASQLLTELVQKAHNNVLFRFVRSPKSRLYGEARRHACVRWFPFVPVCQPF